MGGERGGGGGGGITSGLEMSSVVKHIHHSLL